MATRGSARGVLAVAVVLGATARAHASGFELVEQSPEAIATAGAQTADADAAAAVYYDPAALAFQPGLTVQGGANLLRLPRRRHAGVGRRRSRRRRSTPRRRCSSASASARATPSASASSIPSPVDRRIPRDGPAAWSGWRSSCARWRSTRRWRCARLPGWPSALASTSCRRRCRIGARPRSAAATRASSPSTSAAPVSAATRRSWCASCRAGSTPPSPTAAPSISICRRARPRPRCRCRTRSPSRIASRPVAGLTLTTDVRLTLWQDLRAVVVHLQRHDHAGKETVTLNWRRHRRSARRRDLSFLARRRRSSRAWPCASAAGWEQGPTSAAATSPLLPDGDRILVGGGVGARWRFVAVDAGYLAAIASDFLGASGDVRRALSRGHPHRVGRAHLPFAEFPRSSERARFHAVIEDAGAEGSTSRGITSALQQRRRGGRNLELPHQPRDQLVVDRLAAPPRRAPRRTCARRRSCRVRRRRRCAPTTRRMSAPALASVMSVRTER